MFLGALDTGEGAQSAGASIFRCLKGENGFHAGIAPQCLVGPHMRPRSPRFLISCRRLTSLALL